ncbi:type II secretion system F family protein [Agromyces sp. Marseille-P2726]|uniref:type II secretion system F family protein n=1 Tax=Agromyces sp. Marseille-P2726 TaxID=2709132 RepID=UPI00156F0498|nr:type II secretion system F family protein [Agromyces sp. Marseille-P2726]
MTGLAVRSPLLARVRSRLRRADPAAGVDTVAAVAERVAALLSAGVPAPSAWSHVRERRAGTATDLPATLDAEHAVLDAAADAAGRGDSVSGAIAAALRNQPAASSEWSVLGAAWSVAVASGAPLAASLLTFAAALRDEAQLRREVRSALAGPLASARLVTALPLIAVAFGVLLGFDTLGVLFGGPVGIACVVVGAALLWAGRSWSMRLARRASRSSAGAGLDLELLAIAMSGGASVERSRALVAETLAAHRIPNDDHRAHEVIALAERAGAPIADLLRAEAFRVRRVARAEGAVRAAALGARLMLPLGACVLPAFVLLGVVPLLVSVVSGTLGGAA